MLLVFCWYYARPDVTLLQNNKNAVQNPEKTITVPIIVIVTEHTKCQSLLSSSPIYSEDAESPLKSDCRNERSNHYGQLDSTLLHYKKRLRIYDQNVPFYGTLKRVILFVHRVAGRLMRKPEKNLLSRITYKRPLELVISFNWQMIIIFWQLQ